MTLPNNSRFSNQVKSAPFLRTSRNFPLEVQPLGVEINKSYIDIANAVNLRTIGIFSSGLNSVTGEKWTIDKNQTQQSFRQVYPITNTTTIDHGIKSFTQISPSSYGSFTDGTNFYGLPFASSVAIAGQISFYVTNTQIIFVTGGGAPALTNGIVVVEWLSQA